MITRRFFIGGCASFAALAPNRIFAVPAGAANGEKPLLRFGVVSDVHVAVSGPDWKMPPGHDTATLVKALSFFRDQGADVVVIAGDMAHHGLGPELVKVAEAWFGVFPNDRAPDGRKVERLFITGNHDNGHKRGESVLRDKALVEANLICRNRGKWWDAAFHEEFRPMWRKTVKGRHVKAEVWKLEFPRADAVRNARAMVYEAIAKNAKGKDESFFLSACQDFCYGAGDRRRRRPLVLKIAASRLAAEPAFRVHAASAWGKKSAPLA